MILQHSYCVLHEKKNGMCLILVVYMLLDKYFEQKIKIQRRKTY